MKPTIKSRRAHSRRLEMVVLLERSLGTERAIELLRLLDAVLTPERKILVVLPAPSGRKKKKQATVAVEFSGKR